MFVRTKLKQPLFSQFRAQWRDYLVLCKPRVVALMLLTTLVGVCLADPVLSQFSTIFFALLGIGLSAGGAAALNHLVDKKIDAMMERTQQRPLVQEKISSKQALYFALSMGGIGLFILMIGVNLLTAFLTFFTFIGYAGIYTGYLKRATPQNIVIGGLSGAMPPLLGWTAITNQLDPEPLLLVLIIFIWTPPHFWALAIHRLEEYKKAKIPMLPVTHGIPFTKLNILLYTILLFVVSLLPFLIGMSGWIYCLGTIVIGCRFLHWAIILYRNKEASAAMYTFRFSIIYLMVLYLLLLIDHYIRSSL